MGARLLLFTLQNYLMTLDVFGFPYFCQTPEQAEPHQLAGLVPQVSYETIFEGCHIISTYPDIKDIAFASTHNNKISRGMSESESCISAYIMKQELLC